MCLYFKTLNNKEVRLLKFTRIISGIEIIKIIVNEEEYWTKEIKYQDYQKVLDERFKTKNT